MINFKQTNADILLPAEKIAKFIQTRDLHALAEAFAPDNIILIDSFAPYIFQGEKAVLQWAKGFIAHAKNLKNLHHTFGEPQEYSSDGKVAFLSLPTTWEGLSNNKPFHETGGLTLVLVHIEGGWKIQSYSWAVTSYTEHKVIEK